MFVLPRHVQNVLARSLQWPVGLTCVRLVHLFVLFSSLLSAVHAQCAPPVSAQQAQKTSPTDLATSGQQVVPTHIPAVQEQHSRLFGILPTYSVSNSQSPISLSSGGKFRLFVKGATDPFTLTYTAFNAGIQQAQGDLSGFGQGSAGYGKRLGAGLADETSAGFFSAYLFPSLLHQDPRYFRQGSGSFKSRLAHAFIRPVVIRKDSGGRAFNWSGFVGSIAASTLSNSYYPATDRGVGPTFERVATGIPFAVIDHLIDEFGPDLERQILRKKSAGP